ncbi:LiaI-LiaF-like domain-containing protein [Halanaerobium hydrogeniformans]|uniref:LiaI-LiaF-like transmembrane region domain-containing protein n=1 Tax=Halanaerobium hydrogeniformans TaxID=656519 RepID=E4RJK2_HALHG|nr:DUF5668 domain-containing protein [Halanaerobium hydrogeniformans]ADQ15422.1 hypothetical protein Halsa_2005 [Halanaerobium hydrogeniformans]
MTDNRSQNILGLILIITGIIFLGETLGIYQFNLALFIRSYWPVLLIIYGLHVLLQNSSFWFIVPLLIIIAAGFLIYLLINHGPVPQMPMFRHRMFNFGNLPLV